MRPRFCRPRLEHLETRACPATATWNAETPGAWTNAANWKWSDNSTGHYPGDTSGQKDDVSFDSTSRVTCTLTGNLTETLKSLYLWTGFGTTGQVTLGGNVTVAGGSGFVVLGGTLSISSGKTLTLGAPAAMNNYVNVYQGGLITGLGTLKNDSGEFDIYSSASSLGCDLSVTGGSVDLVGMTGNLALSGPSNNITVTGGSLNLLNDVASGDAFTKGGITGGNDHYILVESGGTLNRGTAGNTVGGSVLISVPVTIDGGTLNVYYAEPTGGSEKDVLKIQGADATDGSSLVVVDYGTADLDPDTELTVNNDVYVDAGGELILRTGGSYDTKVNGNVVFGATGGDLKILDASAGDFGTVTINGNLTLTSYSTFTENWGDDGNDRLDVIGTATLAGTIKMVGPGPLQSTWTTVIGAVSVSGNFASPLQWTGHPDVTLSFRTQSNEDNIDCQLKWEGGGM